MIIPTIKNKRMKEIIFFGHKISMQLSGTGLPPDDKSGLSLNAFCLYIKIDDSKWFAPHGRFSMNQIVEMLEICDTEYQVISLFEMLSVIKN